MQFSQHSMASEKMTQSQQQTNNIDFMEVDYKPSICNVSHVDGVMSSLETGLSSSYQCSSGLMRYHSAPSSFYSSLEEEENNEIIAQYFSNNSGPSQSNVKTMQQHQSSVSPSHLGKNEPAKHHGECPEYMKRNSLQLPSLKRSAGHVGREDLGKHHHLVAILENGPDVSTDSFGSSHMSFMSQAQASQPGAQNMDSKQTNTVSCDLLGRGTNASSTSKSTLIRHSSSPAGLLSGLVSEVQGAFQSGFLDEKVRNSMGLGSSCGDNIPPSRVQGQMNCLRQNSSPPGLLSQLAMDMGVLKVGDRLNMSIAGSSAENKPRSSSDDGNLSSGNVRQGYISNFQVGTWEDATIPSGNPSGMQNGTNFSARKRAKELDETMMQGLRNTDTHKIEGGNRVASALINRPYNLPRSTSAELAMDEFLQDSVPCKVRAKRGCATHPRSIAERVRRTRISERMRKLQDLVPNSDKQTTNIADMLDEAVEYVKSLQKQVQVRFWRSIIPLHGSETSRALDKNCICLPNTDSLLKEKAHRTYMTSGRNSLNIEPSVHVHIIQNVHSNHNVAGL